MRKLLVGLVISACMFAFAGCKEDKEEAEENVKQGNTSVTYYLVGEEAVDYFDIHILELDKEEDVIGVKDIRIISGKNPVQVQSEKGCTNLVIVYKHRYRDDNNLTACRRYTLNEEEFREEKDYIMLTLGETIDEEVYDMYFNYRKSPFLSM